MELDFEKGGGLLPAIVQDAATRQVLMLGYMNAEALTQTRREGKVTFWSRSKDRLWTKGESSGNFLLVDAIHADCDADTLLILARPQGPVCHTGSVTCFAGDVLPEPSEPDQAKAMVAGETVQATEMNEGPIMEKKPALSGFLYELEEVIAARSMGDAEGSYTASLFNKGVNKIAQKVGEEAVEVVIEAMANNEKLLLNESADLLYHLIVLLRFRGLGLADVEAVLRERAK